jgi:hypothetical protein
MSLSWCFIKTKIKVGYSICLKTSSIYAFFFLSSHSVKDTMTMMRAYLQLVSSHWSPHWRMFRRWVIFKYYADYLVKIYQNNTYIANEANK